MLITWMVLLNSSSSHHNVKYAIIHQPRVATLSQQQNSLTFSWLNSIFPWPKYCVFMAFFFFLQPINDKSSLSSSPILEFQKIKCLKSYKLLIILGKRSEREKNNIFKQLKMDKIPATTQIFLTQIIKFPDFSPDFLDINLKFLWPICKIPWLFPDLEEKIKFPWPVATLSAICNHCPQPWWDNIFISQSPVIIIPALWAIASPSTWGLTPS